jgi:hypothetical protein
MCRTKGKKTEAPPFARAVSESVHSSNTAHPLASLTCKNHALETTLRPRRSAPGP